MRFLSQARRTRRVPLYTTVDLHGVELPSIAYATNLSEGGLSLKAVDASPQSLPRGARVVVSLRLPGAQQRLSVAGRIVWAGEAGPGAAGRGSRAAGVQFDPGQDSQQEQIRAFIEAFRPRVGLVGGDPEWIREALGDLLELEAWANPEAVQKGLGTGQAQLVIVLQGPEESPLAFVEAVLRAPASEPQATILYCGGGDPQVLESLAMNSGRVMALGPSPSRVTLRSSAQRALDAQLVRAENERLTAELEDALRQLKQENQALRAHVIGSSRLEGIIGDSPAIRRVCDLVHRVAPLPSTVTLLGESGSGKELVARAIHARSARAVRPFVAQNCAAVSESLLDAELFGHVRGAFTGAVSDRSGLFESADGGTVFLDEVGEMTPGMQAKLLRVLQEGEIRRIGSARSIKLDVRVLCATHRDLESMVEAGTFREDLYYRLNAFVIRIPPLRERRDDIAALSVHFLDRFAQLFGRPTPRITETAMRTLEAFAWPGNVRQLQNMMERLMVLADPAVPLDEELVREALGIKSELEFTAKAGAETLDAAVESFERALIAAELQRTGGVLSNAARRLGVNRTTLSKRCKRLGIRLSGQAAENVG